VLDDYHCVRSAEIDAAMTFFIERLPPGLRLIIVTREDPRLPLARWRSLERVAEIGMENLRFSYDEVVAFLRQTMNLQIDDRAARTLETRTEGWVAALQLAGLSLQLRGEGGAPEAADGAAEFSGRHRYLVDYLAEEVLRHQPAALQSFLQRTAALNRMCAPLCDEVTGRGDSEAVLTRLEQGNMFLVRLDEERQWYRYHPLFADFLRRGLAAADEREVHRKAAGWFERQGIGDEAIRHAIAAGEFDAAVRLVRSQMEKTLARGELPTVVAWLRQLPEEVLRAHADLAGYRAWLLYMGGRSAEAEVYAAMADRGAGPAGTRAPGTGALAVAGGHSILLALRAFIALNWADPRDAVPLAQQALELLAGDAAFFRVYTQCLLGQAQALTGDRRTAVETLRHATERAGQIGNQLMRLDALGHLALVLHAQGQLREAIVLCRNAIDEYVDSGEKPLPITGLVAVPLGILYYETGAVDSAELFLETGIGLCQGLGMGYFKLRGLCAMAKLQYHRGEHDLAWSTLAAARESYGRPESPRRFRLVAAATAELQLHDGNLDAAARTLESARRWPGKATEAETLVHARVLLAQQNASAAWKLLAPLEEAALAQQSAGSLVAIHVLQSLCRRALAQPAGAVELLGKAVSLAASAGYRRVFLDEITQLGSLLEQVRHVAPAFVSGLLAPPAEPPLAHGSPLPEGLTRVEHDILALLSRGLTNQEIAGQLNITVGTTKWRMNQIFGKLQVRNRVEALARARQLRLL